MISLEPEVLDQNREADLSIPFKVKTALKNFAQEYGKEYGKIAGLVMVIAPALTYCINKKPITVKSLAGNLIGIGLYLGAYHGCRTLKKKYARVKR